MYFYQRKLQMSDICFIQELPLIETIGERCLCTKQVASESKVRL